MKAPTGRSTGDSSSNTSGKALVALPVHLHGRNQLDLGLPDVLLYQGRGGRNPRHQSRHPARHNASQVHLRQQPGKTPKKHGEDRVSMGRKIDAGISVSKRPPGAAQRLLLIAVFYMGTQILLNFLARLRASKSSSPRESPARCGRTCIAKSSNSQCHSISR